MVKISSSPNKMISEWKIKINEQLDVFRRYVNVLVHRERVAKDIFS